MIRSIIHHWIFWSAVVIGILVGKWWSVAILITLPLTLILYVKLNNVSQSWVSVLRATWRFWRIRHSWRWACEKAQLDDEGKPPRLLGISHHYPPHIANDKGTALQFMVSLQRVGLTVQHLEENKEYLASSLNARRIRVIKVNPALARVIFEFDKRLRGPKINAGADRANQLPRIQLDIDVWLELETSLLVVGESGTGKSNLTWYILNHLNGLHIPYRLFVLDPKKVELAETVDSPYIQAYADDIDDLDGVVEKFYLSMMDTYARMKKEKLRRVPIGHLFPLNILLIDELLLCDQAQQGTSSHLAKTLISGRAAGHIVIANSQLGQVDAISRIRDLFPDQRVCFHVTSPDLVNAVLGPRSEERGAKCVDIEEAGVGYIYTQFTGGFARFQLPFMVDVEAIARGEFWQLKTTNSTTKTLRSPKNKLV
jgi:energy-coupling factor transporter ATP-binding protein EcfA2